MSTKTGIEWADVHSRCYRQGGADFSAQLGEGHTVVCTATNGGCHRCWRCGQASHGLWPYCLCHPCVDVVSPEEIAWLNDRTREPDKTSWEMMPLGRPQGIA